MRNERNKPEIRALSRGYGSRIVEIHRNAFSEDIVDYSIYASDKVDNYIESILDDPAQEFFGAFIENECIGYTQVRYIDDEGHWNYMAVLQKIQAAGTGSALLKNVLDRAVMRSSKNVRLEVQESNKRLLDWYANEKFELESSTNLYLASQQLEPKIASSDIAITSTTDMSIQFERFGLSQIGLNLDGKEYKVGVIGEKLYMLGGEHDQRLITALQSLDPSRKILIVIREDEELNCNAILHDRTLTVVRKL